MELRYKNVSLSGHDLDELNKGHFSAAEPKLETKIKEFLDLPQTKFDKTYEIVEYSHVTFPQYNTIQAKKPFVLRCQTCLNISVFSQPPVKLMMALTASSLQSTV